MVLNRFKIEVSKFNRPLAPTSERQQNPWNPFVLIVWLPDMGWNCIRQAGHHWNLKAFILVEASAKKLILYFLETDKPIKGIHIIDE